MRSAGFGGQGFGDAGGFGDIVDATVLYSRPPRQAQGSCRRGGFGDADGFGDAGGFDLAGIGRRRSDRTQ